MIAGVNHPFYLLLRRILSVPLKWIFWIQGFRVTGRSHLPRRRSAAVVICNHAAFVDSIYLIIAIRPRFAICGARPKYFVKRATRFLLRTANILKVENEDQFKEDCLSLLRAGEIILIYPEMGRNPGGMGRFRVWAAEIALEADVPVIPCYLYGTTDGQTPPKRLIVGEPIRPSGDKRTLTRHFRETLESLKTGVGAV